MRPALALTTAFVVTTSFLACGGSDDDSSTAPSGTAGAGAAGSTGSGAGAAGAASGGAGASSGAAGSGGSAAGTAGTAGSSAGAGGTSAAGSAGTGGGAAGAAGANVGGQCDRPLAAADRDRFVVIGHASGTSAGAKAKDWEVLALAKDGTLTRPGTHFTMGVPADHRVTFSNDGAIGYAVQDDGTLGIFQLSATGSVTVIEAGWKGAFGYASAFALSTDGKTAYVTNENWPDSGGGVYALAVQCDGRLVDLGKVVSTKNAWKGPVLLDDGTAVTFSRATPGADPASNVVRFSLGVPGMVKAGVDAFGDDNAIVVATARSRNGKHVLFGDDNAFDPTQRIAVVDVSGGGLAKAQLLPSLPAIAGIALSPFDDLAVVTMWESGSYAVLDYAPAAAQPFTLKTTVKGVQVPGVHAMVERGPLDGRVLVSEVRGVYRLQFQKGAVMDLGVFDLGMGLENIVTGIGVQP